MSVFNVMVQFITKVEVTDSQWAQLEALGASDIECTDEIDGELHHRAWVYDMSKLGEVVAYAQTL